MAAPPVDRAGPTARSGWSADLGPRVASGIVLAAGALLAVFAGPTAFELLACAIAAVLAWEWTRLCGDGRFGATGLALALAVVGVVVMAATERVWLPLALILASSVMVFWFARGSARAHPLWVAFGPVYIGVPMAALIWLRGEDDSGRALVLWLLVTVWATDTGAYFAGRLIGGPRLAPRVSPNKTWAGLIGAMVSAGLVGVGAHWWAHPRGPDVALLAGAGAALAVVAQAGDIGESWMKRRFGVKDSSGLIPGHGGMMDRLDGLLAAAVALALWHWATGGGVLTWR